MATKIRTSLFSFEGGTSLWAQSHQDSFLGGIYDVTLKSKRTPSQPPLLPEGKERIFKAHHLLAAHAISASCRTRFLASSARSKPPNITQHSLQTMSCNASFTSKYIKRYQEYIISQINQLFGSAKPIFLKKTWSIMVPLRNCRNPILQSFSF